MRSFIIALILLMMLSACAYGPKRLYKGPELEEEQVARLCIMTPSGIIAPKKKYYLEPLYYPVRIDMVKFDDESVSAPTSRHGYNILPGKHSIELKYTWDAPEASEGELSKEIAVNVALLPLMILAGAAKHPVEIVDLPDSECICTMTFNAEAGHQYVIKGKHGLDGQPVLSVVEFELTDKTCQDESEEEERGPPLCVSDIIFGDEVAKVPCKRIVKK